MAVVVGCHLVYMDLFLSGYGDQCERMRLANRVICINEKQKITGSLMKTKIETN